MQAPSNRNALGAVLVYGLFLLAAPAVAAQGGSPTHPLMTDPTLPAPVYEALLESSGPLRNQVSGTTSRRLAGEKAPDAIHAVVLMCDFSDSLLLGRFGLVEGDFPEPRQSEIYYDAHDSLYFHNLLGDVARYYGAVSGGRFTFDFAIWPHPVNLPRGMDFYGNHPTEGEQPFLLVAEVVAALDEDVDFSPFDTVILIHAGAGEETDILGDSPEQIYSTYLDPDDFKGAVEDGLLDEPFLAGGDFGGERGLDHVLILPETEYQDPLGGYGGFFGSLGVYCFEVGLRLGMLSLSDFTPAGRPDSQGIGEFGLMGYGLFVGLGWIPPQPIAFNKMLMGWLDPFAVDPGVYATHDLAPAGNPADPLSCARVDVNGQEYWLLEYRLQDPDGNGIFSFADDKNGDGIPNFWDASNPPLHFPAGYFDASEDSVEVLTGAEWDFFMSENSARAEGVKGAGSGVYIWHVDEGVIRDVFGGPNLYNADPGHKAVDLEEADGIQDLDSGIPSEYILGGDDDSFRGEGAAEFTPFTRPDTGTASGAATGIHFLDFSDVLLDDRGYVLSVDGGDTLWGKTYADRVSFTVMTSGAGGEGPVLGARRTLPDGVDLRGGHVLVGDLDGGGTPDEIVLTGADGEIFVLDGNLDEYLDRDGDPATFEPFAVGTRDGEPVMWNPPAAMGDVDADGQPEIVLTAANGIYAFNADGSPVSDDTGASFGLLQVLPGVCRLPVVLDPGLGSSYLPTVAQPVDVIVVVEDGGYSLRRYAVGVPGFQQVEGDGSVPSARPVMGSEGVFFLACGDTSGQGDHRLEIWGPDVLVQGGLSLHVTLPLGVRPGPVPVLAGSLGGDSLDPTLTIMVSGASGGGQTVFADGLGNEVREAIPWSDRMEVGSPLAPGGAFLGPDIMGRVGHFGDWQDGWPRTGGGAGNNPHPGGPLVCRLLGSDLPLDQYIFPLEDGRIMARGTMGEAIPGWPLAGPGTCAGTPALGNLGGGEGSDLVAIGTFDRITGLELGEGRLEGSPVSTVMVWNDVAEPDPVWPMDGGNLWRNGAYDAAGWNTLPEPAPGLGLVSGSHLVTPNPLHSGPLFVRGLLRSPGKARAAVYTVEGERVASTGWREVSFGDPFTLELGLDGVVTGMYLCRLEVETGGKMDYSVRTFAVVR